VRGFDSDEGVGRRLLLSVQAANCFDLYFLASVLSAAEIDKFTQWLVANKEIPGLCAQGDPAQEVTGSCLYVEGQFHAPGMLLTFAVMFVHWLGLWYTVHIAHKTGIRAIQCE